MKCFPEKLLLFILLLCFYKTGIGQQLVRPNSADSLFKQGMYSTPEIFNISTEITFDSTQLLVFYKKYPLIKKYNSEIRSFYRKRNYTYAWYQKGTLTDQATNFSNRILNLENDGIYKKIYYQVVVDSLLNTSNKLKKIDITLELMLTAEYFLFSKVAWEGMNIATSKSAEWYLPRKNVSYEQYLDSLLNAPVQKLNSNEPVYRQYELLRGFLIKYVGLNSHDRWIPIVMKNKFSKIGDSSLNIDLLKKRLYKLEDYQGDTLSCLFNSDLENGVKNFQDRHGLTTDGIINQATLDEINIPLKSRIRQIVVNMERCRWLPVRVSKNYIAVNIPEYKLHVYTDDSLLWSSNVVVGKSVRQTTIFYGDIKYVVFSPYWNVPEGIVRNEVVPGMKRSTNYLAALNMEITGYHNGLPIVRQKPGRLNSLGLVKFLFPNSYNIYLHDTPSKSLFKQSSRAFSHGCIRVGDPAKLASFLLGDTTLWSTAKINTAMHAGYEEYVTLTNTVPVFIAYLTAFTDRGNKINFRKDIYNLDEQLASRIIAGEGIY